MTIHGPDLNEIEQTNSCAVIAAGPGAVLRAARESKGFSLKDISERLRLNTTILESIEDDEYTDGTALVFIRGYLRSYAMLLGLETQKIMDAFETLGLTEVRDFTEFVKPKNRHESRNQVPISMGCNPITLWASLACLSLAIVGLLWVYVGDMPDTHLATTKTSVETHELAEKAAVAQPGTKITQPTDAATIKAREGKVATLPAETNPQAEALIF